MAKTSPELLQDILGVLGQISSKIDANRNTTKTSGTYASKDARTAQGASMDLKGLTIEKNKSEKIKDTAAAIKDLASALEPLSKGLLKFALIPERVKRSLIYFLHDILQQSSFRGTKAVVQAKIMSDVMSTLGEALPKLAKGVRSFGLMQKLGLVTATNIGIKSIMTTMAAVGNPATLPFVLAASVALAGLGVALNGMANVLKSLSLVILGFAGGIVIMVGALWLAQKTFGLSGPLEAMGVVVGSIAVLAGGFVMIGLMSPLILLSGNAIAAMGIGMALVGIGILALVGSFALINKISGGPKETAMIAGIAALTITGLGIAFSLLGALAILIIPGAKAVQHMGKGMIFFAGGILAMGISVGLISLMGIDIGDMFVNIAKGIGLLSLVFAGAGLFSPLILLGVIPIIAISATVGLFALSALSVGLVIEKIGGKTGLSNLSNNISLLVGGVLSGVIQGVSRGLLGENGDSKSFFGKIGTVAKNVMILIGSIGLLMGVSSALIMFGFALKAFTQAGSIKTVTGYKENGDPIFGETVSVVNAGKNIAESIGAFFTTLTKTMEDPNIIPSAAKMAVISQLLLGVKGPKLLGIRLWSAEQPGILDAVSKFAEVITMFSKVNQIPVYDVDSQGNTKVKSITSPAKVATNIVLSLKAFFGAFKANQDMLKGISTDSVQKLSTILFGTNMSAKLFGIFGTSVKIPGILEPIAKFTDIISQYAKFGEDNSLPMGVDEKGNPLKAVSVDSIAKNMVKGISAFLKSLSSELSTSGKTFEENSKNILNNISVFSKVVDKLNDMTDAQEGIDKLANSIGLLATNTGLLVTNMGNLNTENLDKLAVITAKHAVTTRGITIPTQQQMAAQSSNTSTQPSGLSEEDWDRIAEIIGNKIAAKLADTGKGEFKFTFYGENQGILTRK